MKYLVTGAAGFIGFHVAERLLARGHDVVGLDNLNPYYDPNLKLARLARLDGKERFSFVRIDITDRSSMHDLFAREGFNRVIHLAAQAGVRYSVTNPHAYVESNVTGFLHVLEGCRETEVEHLTYASTSSVYGLNADMPFSPSRGADHPVSLYGATKKANEMMAHAYAHLFRIPCTGLRFFTVYGPWGRPDMALFLFAEAMLAGRPITLYNEGRMVRDFTFIDDIAEGVVRVSECPPVANPDWDAVRHDPATSSAPYRLFNIGNHQPTSLMHYVKALEDALGVRAEIRYAPMQPGDVAATHADVEALVACTGFRPSTPVVEGVRRFADWYRGYVNA